MALAPGTRLGPYEVTSAIGAGGMGEVYRARDSRLGREVAIKVLPPAFSADADRLRRFEQEARATATLNHPNILAVYDVGTHDGSPYIVSELLQGDTLRERLAKRSSTSGSAIAPSGLSVRKAIDYAIQIAHGLSAAHDKGIVHRDLKPENVFVTNDGHVKILDFGLAKLKPELSAAGEQTVLATESVDTQRGMLLGTMGYMAPEQVRGQAVDHRSDIFAFGAVLYEMLAGQRAFHGASPADTISAILDKDPIDLPVVERHIPPALERVVDRCLAKNPGSRFQATSDLAFALEALSSYSERSEVGAGISTPGATTPSRERLAWSMAALFAAIAAGVFGLGAAGYFKAAPPVALVSRSTVLLPETATYAPAGTPAYRLSLSPDGKRLAYVASAAKGLGFQIWVRPLDSLTAQPLAGTESQNGQSGPFWSPDSKFIGYLSNVPTMVVKKIDASGGPPLTLAQFPSGQPNNGAGAGATWSKQDVILWGGTGPVGGPIRRASASGGEMSVVISPDTKNGETELWYPYFLPDGNHFLFLAVGPLDGIATRPLGIYATTLEGKERKLIMRGGSNMKYVNGYLLFLRDATLMAQKFDPDRLELAGDAVPIAERVQIGGPSGATGPYAVSENGILAYISGDPLGVGNPSQLTWVGRDGRPVGMLGDAAPYADVELSHDATRAVVSVLDPAQRTADLWIFDIARGLRTKLTFAAGNEGYPVWSPDDRRVIYSAQATPTTILWKTADGSGVEEKVFEHTTVVTARSWSRDGKFVAVDSGAPGGLDIGVLEMAGERKVTSVVQSGANEFNGHFSPDGRWISYASNESGRAEIYVAPFPGPGGKSLVSTAGGLQPRWRQDGSEIFYIGLDNKMMSASVNGKGNAFQVGAVKPLFDVSQRSGPVVRSQYDVTPDGQRFLINMPARQQQESTPPITLVTNWTAGLKDGEVAGVSARCQVPGARVSAKCLGARVRASAKCNVPGQRGRTRTDWAGHPPWHMAPGTWHLSLNVHHPDVRHVLAPGEVDVLPVVGDVGSEHAALAGEIGHGLFALAVGRHAPDVEARPLELVGRAAAFAEGVEVHPFAVG